MRLIAAAALCIGLLAIGADDAEAYPQFQFSTYNERCNLCHFSPVGGGLINEYGRDEAGDTISRGGSGKFLHGLWDPPESFQIGGDYRGAGMIRETTGDIELLGFPMQADLYTRAAVSNVSFNLIVGMRGSARGETDLAERFISREHFLMYQDKLDSPYVRVGRFFAPWGLRNPDHTTYVRRFTGFHALEETYNISGGLFKDDWEAHFTAFMAPPIFGVGPKHNGGVAYYEKRIKDDTAMVGGQARVGIGPDDSTYMVGGVTKWYFEDQKLMLQGELDLGLQTIDADGGHSRGQLAAYLGATYFFKDGIMFGTALEKWVPDLAVADTTREAFQINMQYFPRAHWEIMLMSKLEFQGLFELDPSQTHMFMLHYYL
jgi:hypothetical protein